MTFREKNKEFILQYYEALEWAKQHGPDAVLAAAGRHTTNHKLLDHLAFFVKGFPNADFVVEDIMAEGDRVFVRERFVGKHEGEIDDIPPTYKVVTTPFALCYTICNDKIVDFWAIGNELDFLEQLDISKEQLKRPRA